ncbi:RnfABCDGE type electron transport complex subunit C [bacterium]|nr:RnfABCDGE type electron transport complex subunit C [bacterium]
MDHGLSVKTFRYGGIHPPYYKGSTAAKPIVSSTIPKEIYIPLSQHIGVPSKPIVKAGEHVKTGQKIGEAVANATSASIHSSVTGKVIAIGNRPHFTGFDMPCIVIRPDPVQEDVTFTGYPDFVRLSPDEIRGIVREAGIVGMGGATFPTHLKLSPPGDKTIESIIINGCECEPFLSCDHRSMVERPRDIITGIRIILHTLKARRAYIGIEINKMDALETVRGAISHESAMTVIPLSVKYPEGGEKQLIQAILDREVPLRKLPWEVGVLVFNIQTTIAIADAVVKGRPLFERVVTLSGPLLKNTQNLRVRIGTPIRHLIDQCGGFKEDPEKYIHAGHMRYDTKVLRLVFKGEFAKVIMGGPMTGFAQPNLFAPVVKGTSGVLAFPESMIPTETTRPCLKCGKCNSACPMLLMPSLMGVYVEQRKIGAAADCGILDCIECGCCAYVCPAHRPLIQLMRIGKGRILSRRKA